MKMMLVLLILSLLMSVPALCETSVWIAKTDSSITYIGGTIHMLRGSDRPFPPEFDRAYDASDMIIFETDLAVLQSPEIQQELLAKAVYSDGRTLDKVLSAEAYKKLEEYCTENGIPLAMINQYKPWAIVMTIIGMELQKMGANQEGIDLYYYGKASEDEKSMGGLEAVDEQVEILTSMGDGNESAFIVYNIDHMEKMEEMFDSLITAWRSGDEAILSDAFLEEAKKEFPKLFKTLFTDRNMSWLPKIEEYLLTPETEFVLVGTAHLVGEEGIITQLEKLGYEVEKLK